jgi:NhaP-type Na+/H+ or K+/H+ antiporter
MEYSGEDSTFSYTTPLKIIWSFLFLSFFSVLTGLLMGLFSSFFLKTFRFVTTNPIIECNMIFCFGYLSYSFAEFFHFSGIIALLTCGILMSHYTWYNLSPQAKNVTSVAF